MLRDAVFVFQLDWVCACFSQSSAGSVFSRSVELGFSPFLYGFTQFLVDLLHGFVPVWL